MKNVLHFCSPLSLTLFAAFLSITACEKSPVDELDPSKTPLGQEDILPAKYGPQPAAIDSVSPQSAPVLPKQAGTKLPGQSRETLAAQAAINGPGRLHMTSDVINGDTPDVTPTQTGPKLPDVTERVLGSDALDTKVKPAATFHFNISVSPCLVSGNSVSISISKPENYSFLWKIDGKIVSQEMTIPGCVSGQYAQLWVTRLSDRTTQTQVVELPNSVGPDVH